MTAKLHLWKFTKQCARYEICSRLPPTRMSIRHYQDERIWPISRWNFKGKKHTFLVCPVSVFMGSPLLESQIRIVLSTEQVKSFFPSPEKKHRAIFHRECGSLSATNPWVMSVKLCDMIPITGLPERNCFISRSSNCSINRKGTPKILM